MTDYLFVLHTLFKYTMYKEYAPELDNDYRVTMNHIAWTFMDVIFSFLFIMSSTFINTVYIR